MTAPLAGATPLIDIHAHFYQPGVKVDGEHLNRRRMEVGDLIGIRCHVASVLGSWGVTSPTYFQSPRDTVVANDFMLSLQAADARVRTYVAVNPNDTVLALEEMDRCRARGAIGLKLAAARRCDDPVVDPVIERAGRYGFPVLHHIWQHRRRHWPGQDISDGADLCALARRHPEVNFILAHIGGGGDYAHTFAAVRDVPNVYLDLSGSGVDRGMLDGAYAAVGAKRLLWGADLTLCTALAKLWALEAVGLSPSELELVRWRNAARIFPPGSFPGLTHEG